ncbi:MAG TPA: hypothetical protein VFA88_04015 [Gaiellaceae bacterium]|nr:hypothetical protein [Gaiellaceae bacterium]
MAVSYELVTRGRAGHEHTRRYTSDSALAPGSVVLVGGRYWLVERVEEARAEAVPARYRLTLRHQDGREEAGAFRRFRADAPAPGHRLTTLEHGAPISWAVVERRLARDDAGTAYLEAVAERDYAETESLPDHQLEHAFERGLVEEDAAAQALARAEAAGLAIELVALEVGQAANWDEAAHYVDSLILPEVGEDVLQLCGVDPDRDPQETWLGTVKARLHADLESFRLDVEGDRDEIEEWDFRGSRIFAAVGNVEDDSNPLSGYGWMCRLVDSGVLAAAGFQRVRKALLPT